MTTAAVDEGTQVESRPQLLFVIPAFNEEENLANLFADLAQTSDLLGVGSRIFIVDDGSADDTSALVEAYSGPLPVELVRLEVNQGPGAAFRTGFTSALQCADPDALIVTLEADTTGDLGALPQMLDEVRRGADVVLADWRMEGVSAHRRLLSAAAGWVVRHSLGLEATTVSSFFRVYRASTLQDASTRYGDRLIRERGFALDHRRLPGWRLGGEGAPAARERGPVRRDAVGDARRGRRRGRHLDRRVVEPLPA